MSCFQILDKIRLIAQEAFDGLEDIRDAEDRQEFVKNHLKRIFDLPHETTMGCGLEDDKEDRLSIWLYEAETIVKELHRLRKEKQGKKKRKK